ncbi:MAG: hypothetical protein JWM27_1116 [Gemmatimonadetes bacterium]|nr:hypothetical protein [Gemmatimonadota bacterium]
MLLFMTALWVVMLAAPVMLLVALLPAGRDCPRCGGDTLSIRMRLLQPVRKLVAHRWCTSCGWEGMMRSTKRLPLTPAFEVVPEDREADDDAPWRGSSGI